MAITCPVMYDPASERRWQMRLPRSAGVPRRPSGTLRPASLAARSSARLVMATAFSAAATRLAPAAASASAVPRPIPWPAALPRATRPASTFPVSAAEEQLDHGDGDVGALHRQLQGQCSRRLAAGADAVRRLARVRYVPFNLRGVVQELRVPHPASQPGQAQVPEWPGEHVQIQPVAALRVAAVGGRAVSTGPGADDRPLVQAHPAADAAQRRDRPLVHLAPAIGPDVEQQVA